MSLGTILINQGSSTQVVVDEVGATKIQVTKLDLGSTGKSVISVSSAVIAASTAGSNVLVLGVPTKQIKPIAVIISSADIVNVRFLSGTTPISGWFYLPARGGFVIPGRLHAAMKTVSGQALHLELTAAVAVGGLIEYIEE